MLCVSHPFQDSSFSQAQRPYVIDLSRSPVFPLFRDPLGIESERWTFAEDFGLVAVRSQSIDSGPFRFSLVQTKTNGQMRTTYRGGGGPPCRLAQLPPTAQWQRRLFFR